MFHGVPHQIQSQKRGAEQRGLGKVKQLRMPRVLGKLSLTQGHSPKHLLPSTGTGVTHPLTCLPQGKRNNKCNPLGKTHTHTQTQSQRKHGLPNVPQGQNRITRAINGNMESQIDCNHEVEKIETQMHPQKFQRASVLSVWFGSASDARVEVLISALSCWRSLVWYMESSSDGLLFHVPGSSSS